MRLLKAIIMAVMQKMTSKSIYAKLVMYGTVICAMAYDVDESIPTEEWKLSNKYWLGEMPSIYDLDTIVDEMSKYGISLEVGKSKPSNWSRDEVRELMETFNRVHDGFCMCSEKKLTIIDTLAKIKKFSNASIVQYAKWNWQMLAKKSSGNQSNAVYIDCQD